MKRLLSMLLVAALLMMVTGVNSVASADDEGIEIGDAELALGNPVPCVLTDETTEGDSGGGTGDCEFK